MFVALARPWCLLDGYNAEDVCNLSAAASWSSCPRSSRHWWPSWAHWSTVAYAIINGTYHPRTSTRPSTSTCTSWPGVWWSRFCSFVYDMPLPIFLPYIVLLYILEVNDIYSFFSFRFQIMKLWERWIQIMLRPHLLWLMKR